MFQLDGWGGHVLQLLLSLLWPALAAPWKYNIEGVAGENMWVLLMSVSKHQIKCFVVKARVFHGLLSPFPEHFHLAPQAKHAVYIA